MVQTKLQAYFMSTMTHFVEVLNKYFHHNVLELDVHHCCHSLLLRPHQGGPEDDTQVGHRHQVELALGGNSAGRGYGHYVRCYSILCYAISNANSFPCSDSFVLYKVLTVLKRPANALRCPQTVKII